MSKDDGPNANLSFSVTASRRTVGSFCPLLENSVYSYVQKVRIIAMRETAMYGTLYGEELPEKIFLSPPSFVLLFVWL